MDFFNWNSEPGSGVLAPSEDNFSYGVLQADIATGNIPWLDSPLFSPAVMAPDGLTLIDDRSNTSFWNFDQSKISSSLGDVIGSLGMAAAKTGIQLAADSVNTQANGSSQLSGFFRNFQSTATGAQLNAGAIATRFQNIIANPIVWLFAVVAVVGIFFLRK